MLFYYPLSVIALNLAGGSGSRAVQGLGVQGPNHQAFWLDVLRFPGSAFGDLGFEASVSGRV